MGAGMCQMRRRTEEEHGERFELKDRKKSKDWNALM